MLILAIDTSTEQAGISAVEDGVPLAEWTWTAAGNHSRHLNSLVQSILTLERIEPRSVDAIVVASGPGSFSGLRVGVSFAKGLALALGIPLIGVSTLDVIAFPGVHTGADVLATIPAGRGELYVGHYRGDWQRMERTRDYDISTPREAAALAGRHTVLSGPGASVVAEELSLHGRAARVESPVWRLRRPGFLAELGSRQLLDGADDQVHTLEPLYLRRSAAEEKRRSSGDRSQD